MSVYEFAGHEFDLRQGRLCDRADDMPLRPPRSRALHDDRRFLVLT